MLGSCHWVGDVWCCRLLERDRCEESVQVGLNIKSGGGMVDAQLDEVQVYLISEATEDLLKSRKANTGSNPVLTAKNIIHCLKTTSSANFYKMKIIKKEFSKPWATMNIWFIPTIAYVWQKSLDVIIPEREFIWWLILPISLGF